MIQSGYETTKMVPKIAMAMGVLYIVRQRWERELAQGATGNLKPRLKPVMK